MTRTGWATKEEHEYLMAQMPEYETCQVKRRYKVFWQRVNSEFLAHFPVIDKLFPGRKVTDLTPEQREMYTTAVVRQQKRLKEWYRWKLNPRSRNAGAVISKKDLHDIYNPRTRALKPYEVFAKMYSQDVEAEKVRRCEAHNIGGRQTLSVWHNVAKDLYSSATSIQRDAVRKRIDDEEEVQRNQTEEEMCPQSYQRYLKKLPSLLGAAVTPAVRKAGVLAFVTIVGPDPEQNGKIACKSLQFGDKPETPVFSQVWDGHDSVFVEELARFARRHEFTPEVCASRSLIPVTIPNISKADDVSEVSKEAPQQPSEVSQNQAPIAQSAQKETPKKTQADSGRQDQSPPQTAGVSIPQASPTTLPPHRESASLSSPTPPSDASPPSSLLDQQEGNFPYQFTNQGGSGGPKFDDDDDDYEEEDEEDSNYFSGLESWDMDMNWKDVDGENLSQQSASNSHRITHGAPAPLQSFGSLLPPADTTWPSPSSNSPSTAADGSQRWPSPLRSSLPPNTTMYQRSTDLSLASSPSSEVGRSSGYPLLPTPPTDLYHSSSSYYQGSTPNGDGPQPSTLHLDHLHNSRDYTFPNQSTHSTRNVTSDRFEPYGPLSYPLEAFDTLQLSAPLPLSAPQQASRLSLSTSPSTSSVEFAPFNPSRTSLALTSLLNGTSGGHSTLATAGNDGTLPSTRLPGANQSAIRSNADSLFPQALLGNGLESPAPNVVPPPPSTPRRITDWLPLRISQPSPPVVPSVPPPNSALPPPSLVTVPSRAPSVPVVPPRHAEVPLPGAPNSSVVTSSPSRATSKPSIVSPLPKPTVSVIVTPPPPPTVFNPPIESSETGAAISPVTQSSDAIPPLSAAPGPPNDVPPTAPKPPADTPPHPPQVLGNVQSPPESHSLQPQNFTSDAPCRRSSRGTVPSKRREQLQLIGSNTPQVSAASDSAVSPAWFTLALENLRSYELGDTWTKLVEKWGHLEVEMGHGKVSKGSLGTNGRPEEWSKWTSKTWQGTRRYDKVPPVHDPADLGIAMTKWWSSLQPSFRASLGEVFPLPVYSSPTTTDGSDPWVGLRKPGPNGFVSVVMLLAWWGKAATVDASEWNEDSLPSWNRLVQDVIAVVDAMSSTPTSSSSSSGISSVAKGAKRPLGKENVAPVASKRRRR